VRDEREEQQPSLVPLSLAILHPRRC